MRDFSEVTLLIVAVLSSRTQSPGPFPHTSVALDLSLDLSFPQASFLPHVQQYVELSA